MSDGDRMYDRAVSLILKQGDRANFELRMHPDDIDAIKDAGLVTGDKILGVPVQRDRTTPMGAVITYPTPPKKGFTQFKKSPEQIADHLCACPPDELRQEVIRIIENERGVTHWYMKQMGRWGRYLQKLRWARKVSDDS